MKNPMTLPDFGRPSKVHYKTHGFGTEWGPKDIHIPLKAFALVPEGQPEDKPTAGRPDGGGAAPAFGKAPINERPHPPLPRCRSGPGLHRRWCGRRCRRRGTLDGLEPGLEARKPGGNLLAEGCQRDTGHRAPAFPARGCP